LQLYAVHDEAWLIAEEARVRRMIKEGMEARRNSEMEMDKGDGMIKEENDARCIDDILKGPKCKPKVHHIMKEATMRSRLDLKVDIWDEMALKDLEVRRKDLEARRKLEVDSRVDNIIKKGKEASRSKLEVDDHRKRDKYVVPARRK
jgi:hypothetical protein